MSAGSTKRRLRPPNTSAGSTRRRLRSPSTSAGSPSEQERHAAERDELAAQRDGLQQELGDALEQLAALGPAAEERDRLRTEVEQLESTLAEAQSAAVAECERLLGDVDRLEGTLAETQSAHEEELGRLRKKRDRIREELDGARTALTEAQALTAEQERRLAEEQERHAGERDELAAHSERLQAELGDALERLAVVGPAAEERDELRTEVERLQHIVAEVRESSAAELRGVLGERDALAAEVEEARELLQQAERVRESQIALEAERDRVLAELGRVQLTATEAQAEAEEQTRLLAEAQDHHHAERETLLAQRTVLEQELGSSIEQLAAAASAADEREAQLQRDSLRLLEALDAVRTLTAELVSGSVELAGGDRAGARAAEVEAEAETEVETEELEVATDEPDAETDEIEYSLFVPGPNGYELVPQTGVPPQAGQTVELVLPDQEEPVLYEVVRSGRTLPDGDVCVYLAQV